MVIEGDEFAGSRARGWGRRGLLRSDRACLGRGAPYNEVRHQLRTNGPYGVTRHPIHTGLLGMLLGTALLVGLGHLLVALPVGLVFIEIRVHIEERLMLATFPEPYARYRRRVPQLVPRLRPHPQS